MLGAQVPIRPFVATVGPCLAQRLSLAAAWRGLELLSRRVRPAACRAPPGKGSCSLSRAESPMISGSRPLPRSAHFTGALRAPCKPNLRSNPAEMPPPPPPPPPAACREPGSATWAGLWVDAETSPSPNRDTRVDGSLGEQVLAALPAPPSHAPFSRGPAPLPPLFPAGASPPRPAAGFVPIFSLLQPAADLLRRFWGAGGRAGP